MGHSRVSKTVTVNTDKDTGGQPETPPVDPLPFTDAQAEQLAKIVGRVVDAQTKALEQKLTKRLQDDQSKQDAKRQKAKQNGDTSASEEEGEP